MRQPTSSQAVPPPAAPTPAIPADSLWHVVMRCSFFKGEIKSVQILRSCGNKKFDAQAIAETKGRHVPEVALGRRKHEYWRTLTWTLAKGAPYAEPCLPPQLAKPMQLKGLAFEITAGISAASTAWRIN